MITPNSCNYNHPTFNANLASPRLKFSQHDFFIKIRGYGKDKNWAQEIIETADSAVRMIRKNRGIENILRMISLGVYEANSKSTDASKRVNTGILRTARIDWFGGEDKDIYTPYDFGGRYSTYSKKINKKRRSPLKAPNDKVGMTIPDGRGFIRHGEPGKINSSLDYVFELFNKNILPYIKGELTSKDLDKVNDAVAEIRWVMAHSTPWLRGSDAISNVLMRAIYKAVGVKTYPPKRNFSFDLEAYCTPLDEYKKKFPTYFTKPPKVME